MTPFRFSLQRVLDVRVLREESAQMEFARSLQGQEEARREVARQDGRLAEAFAQWRDLAEGAGQDVVLWHGQSLYAERVRRERDMARARWEQACEDVRAARDRLVEASRERQVLERLREREAARHRKEMERRETARLDEVSTFRYRAARDARP